MRTCGIAGCEKKHEARGLCNAHYYRLRVHGDPLAGGPSRYKTPEERFDNSWEWSDGVIGEGVDTPCMIWTAADNGAGYGVLSVNGQMTLAHRYYYERFVGPIPAGLTIDHLCRVRNCVNPEHMEPVTNRVNTLRGISPLAVNAVKTHCPRGHALVEGNLRSDGTAEGRRKCLTCKHESSRRKANLISAAHKSLGLTRREYIATYGQSAKVAEDVLIEALIAS